MLCFGFGYKKTAIKRLSYSFYLNHWSGSIKNSYIMCDLLNVTINVKIYKHICIKVLGLLMEAIRNGVVPNHFN